MRENAAELGIDGQRLGIWACSGHGPTALSLLTSDNDEPLQGAALVYPYTLDLDGASDVADAAKQFGFATPLTGRSLDALHSDVPMFVARAGQDAMPGLNRALDAFVGTALGRNLPISLVNHAGGIHGFDLFDDSAVSRQIIRDVLSFLRFRLTAFS